MRISELGRRAGVPLPTVKFYQREGLLHPGLSTARNQADYDYTHVHRLRLIRVLTEVGGLDLAQVRAVIGALEDPSISTHRLLGVAHYSIGAPPNGDEPPRAVAERVEVDRLLDDLGWRVGRDAPGRAELATALAGLRRLGWDATVDIFRPYAEAAFAIAAREIAGVSGEGSRAETVERAVVGTVVFERALVALRRLAHEHHSAAEFDSRSRDLPVATEARHA